MTCTKGRGKEKTWCFRSRGAKITQRDCPILDNGGEEAENGDGPAVGLDEIHKRLHDLGRGTAPRDHERRRESHSNMRTGDSHFHESRSD